MKARSFKHSFISREPIRRQLGKLRSLNIEGLNMPLVVRYPVEPCNLLAWLNVFKSFPHFYFQSRNQDWEIAGCGRYPVSKLDSITLAQWDELQKIHPEAKNLRLFFCRNFTSTDNWSEFSLLQNFLPRRYLERQNDSYFETQLIPISLAQSENDVLQIVDSLKKETAGLDLNLPPSQVLPELSEKKYNPNKEQWNKNIQTILDQISQGSIEKVVLARKTDFSLSTSVNPIALMQSLKNIEQRVYHYLYSPQSGQTFLGASPERLFKIRNSTINSEAIAGTVGREKCTQADLLASEKILHEQSCVVEEIKERLNAIALNVKAEARPTVLKLADMAHLRSRLNGHLKDNIDIEKVLSALHPTAAVCGKPFEAANTLINSIENFSRGLYAGPVGIAKGSEIDCAVALRSCLLRPGMLSVFTGAGIVDGSDAELEWQELETKMTTLIKLFL